MGAASRWDTADQGMARWAARGMDVHYMALVLSCLDAARLTAPRPTPHRVNVDPLALWWFLVLADAVCCSLVEVVRSGPHARGGTLGFFCATVVFVLVPAFPWADSANVASMPIPALPHASPEGRADVTPSAARATACLADWPMHAAVWPRPGAGASAEDCTATSSVAWTGQPWDPMGITVEKWPRRAPWAAAPSCGGAHPSLPNSVTRLAARGAAGVH